MYICVYVDVDMYIRTGVASPCMCKYMYIYVCMYIHIYNYIYIYIHTYTQGAHDLCVHDPSIHLLTYFPTYLLAYFMTDLT